MARNARRDVKRKIDEVLIRRKREEMRNRNMVPARVNKRENGKLAATSIETGVQ